MVALLRHMRSPYHRLSKRSNLVLTMALVLASIVYAAALDYQSRPLNASLERGMFDIETPWTPARAREVLEKIGAEGIEIARKQVLLDFGFLLLYPVALSLACAAAGTYFEGRFGTLGLVIAWSVLLAAPFDAFENVAVLKMLSGAVDAPWPQLSTVCAAFKFALVSAGFAYLLSCAFAATPLVRR